MKTKYDFWMRQTLRERPAMILADWGIEREELKAENEKLKEALRFYADSGNWYNGGWDRNTFSHIDEDFDCSFVKNKKEIYVGGKIARQTLKEIGE